MGIDIDPDLVPPVKLGLHCGQVALSLVVWCLEIAVFTGKDAKVVGNNGWTFGVCFLSIPAWVYLIMTPRFSRTRKFAEPHAMLAVDAVFTIIWLSAFATQAAYNTSGLCGQACSLSKAIVALGVFVTLLFAATTFLSAYTMNYWRFHGALPGYDNRKIRSGDDAAANIDPDKAAFSMAPHDEEAYERVHMHDHDGEHGGDAYDTPGNYGHANPYSADDEVDRYGGRPTDDDTLFDHTQTEYAPRMPTPHVPPPASGSYGAHDMYDEPAKFPAGNYDRVQ